MYQVLVYGDWLSWGIVPNIRERLAFETRWPGVLENRLREAGLEVRVIEDCLNGRRTVWDDPFKARRNGRVGLAQRIEINSPLSLVILLLGTNDFQFNHAYNDAGASAQGIAALVREIRAAPVEPGMPIPEIVIVCPPHINNPRGPIAAKFAGAEERSSGLAATYGEVAEELGCTFFATESVTLSCVVVGIHLDAGRRLTLGEAPANIARGLLPV